MSSKSVIEGRKKISEKMKAIWSNPEYKERLREKRKLYLRNPENKKKLVDSINSWVHTKEHADNVSIQTKKRWIEDDGTWRKKNTEALNKKNSDINHKKKMSIVSSNNMKKLWDTKEFRDKMQKTILTTFADGKFKSCNTKIELTTTANQSSGTPVVSSSINIGNNSDSTRTFDGQISNVRIYEGILSAQEIAQIYQDEKGFYGL